jgi:hypothetical protein
MALNPPKVTLVIIIANNQPGLEVRYVEAFTRYLIYFFEFTDLFNYIFGILYTKEPQILSLIIDEIS